MSWQPPQALLSVILHNTASIRIGCCLLVISGCTSSLSDSPSAVLADDHLSIHRRAAALSADANSADQLDALLFEATRIAWSHNEPVELRLATIDWLAEYDEARFTEQAQRSVVRERDWQIVNRVFDHAAERDWPGFERVALRRLAEPSRVYADADRPESVWLRDTTGRPPQDVAFEVFGGWDADATLIDRVAAWVALSRLVDRPTRDGLLGFAMGTPADQLQHAAQRLDILPDTQAQLLMLLRLSEPVHADLWTAMLQTPLTDDQRLGLAPRHLPAITTQRGRPPTDHATLFTVLAERLDHQPTERRESRALDTAYTEAFIDHRDNLAWGDLLVIETLLNALSDPSLIRDLFAHADTDLADNTTEYGGLLLIDAQSRTAFRAYPPMLRGNDTRYVASDNLLANLPRALAHIHFHASTSRNPEHAGPGRGDLAFAQRFGVSCLVLTFLDRDMLNADYYQPDGIVIDLGTLSRP